MFPEFRPEQVKRTIVRILWNNFITGLVILIPIVITVKVLWWLFLYLDELTQPVATRLVGHEITGLGFVTTIAVVLVTGFFFSRGPMRRILDGFEDVLDYIPIVGTIYGTIKKVLSGFGKPGSREAFKRFVFARLAGRTTPGFVTGTFMLDRKDGSSAEYCSVYVPTNHLYVGDVVLLPIEDVIETDLSVEDGISVILSAGSSIPARIGEK